jgi:hypothetical protein
MHVFNRSLGSNMEKKNESSIWSTAMNSTQPEHSQFFLKDSLIETIDPWISSLLYMFIYWLKCIAEAS